MSYFHTEYRKFLANARSAKVAANVSLFYVASTTKFEGSDSVLNHLSRQSGIVKKKSEEIISAIEASDSLVLDIETTLEFVEGGGAYLPSLDDNFLADRVVTIPTLHIVHWNAENEIQQIRIYWDQGSLLKEVEVIGARSRGWPIRAGSEQSRLLKTAAAAKSAPTSTTPPSNGSKDPVARPGSPGKRRIKDPYAADSLFDLLSPQKAAAAKDSDTPRPSSPGKRHTKDPYAAESLTDLLSPTKRSTDEDIVRPYAAAGVKPPTRDLSDLFIDDEAPGTPSKPERVIAPKAGAGAAQENRIFSSEDHLDQTRAAYKSNPKRFDHFDIGGDEEALQLDKDRAMYKSNPNRFKHFEIGDDDEALQLDKDRAMYKSNPNRFKHFEIGGDDASLELDKDRAMYKSNPKRFNHFQIGDESENPTTPQKPSRAPLSEQARNFGYTEDDAETPPARQAVVKPRRDADVHFEMVDEKEDDGDGRIIGSYQNRGKGLYENRLFGEDGEAMPSEKETKSSRPLSVVHNSNRQKDFDAHWEVNDSNPTPLKPSRENDKPIPSDRQKAIKMMESSWDPYDPSSPAPRPTMTALHNPSRHNQPSWSYGDDE